MATTVDAGLRRTILERVARSSARGGHVRAELAAAAKRPLSVLYGGAHLFKAGSPSKLGGIALAAFEKHAADPRVFGRIVGLVDDALDAEVTDRVAAKLRTRPIEAMCIDFEDGFGPRPDAEEDAEAVRAATELAAVKGDAPRIGMRIKPLAGETAERAARTLDLFLTALVKARGGLPADFSVTLPKISTPDEVTGLVELLVAVEDGLGLPRGSVLVEIMAELPSVFVDARGACMVPELVAAGAGRVRAVHLGAYDLLSSCGVAAPDHQLDHPLCDHARATLRFAVGDGDVAVVDGATTVLPLAPKDGSDASLAVHEAWHLHATNVRRALAVGIHEGWDLHPAQLVARYGAVFAFYAEAKTQMTARLARFVAEATKATRDGQVFDDAATGQGLLVFFLRGLASGALTEADLAATGLSEAELATRSFLQIAQARAGSRA